MGLDIRSRPVAKVTLAACSSLIDLDQYSIHAPYGPIKQNVISNARKELAEVGCARLAGFTRTQALDIVAAETTRLAPSALFSSEE